MNHELVVTSHRADPVLSVTLPLKAECVHAFKVFASTLLSSVKQAREVLRQQRAALCSSTDKVNEHPSSTADVSQSDASRLLSRYREAELQVCLQI